jgi:signal transduction histidine kinase
MPASLSTANGMPFGVGAETSRGEGEQFLLQAFRSFAEAADSLERSYGRLRGEVARLRSELKQSNAGLQRSLEENRQMRQHLDRILDGLPCGVVVTSEDGWVTLANPEGRRLLGLSWAARGEESESEAPQLARGELRHLLQRARSQAGEQEQCLPDGSGGERWLAVRHAAIRDGAEAEAKTSERKTGEERVSEQKIGEEKVSEDLESSSAHSSESVSVFILRDVSDAKRLIQERDKLRREQALAEMSAILAHEIRNPLGSLELFAGLLAGAGLSVECCQWVEQVQAGLRTLAATVNNVLHFHSLPQPERMPIDLGQLLDWASGFLMPMARQARAELCLRNRLHGVWFSADRHRLEQVLLNLVLNAFRAMPGGGWVELSGQKIRQGEAATASISVSDTGPGILAEDLARVFDPGFSKRAGPGLGLTVCRKIVEQHGGSLTAGNRAGSGARFIVTLPLAAQPPQGDDGEARAARAAVAARDPSTARPLRISRSSTPLGMTLGEVGMNEVGNE